MKPLVEECFRGLINAKSKITAVVKGNRKVSGYIRLVDKHMNVLLQKAIETRVQKASSEKGRKRQIEQTFTRHLGNVFIRGETIIAIHVEEHI